MGKLMFKSHEKSRAKVKRGGRYVLPFCPYVQDIGQFGISIIATGLVLSDVHEPDAGMSEALQQFIDENDIDDQLHEGCYAPTNFVMSRIATGHKTLVKTLPFPRREIVVDPQYPRRCGHYIENIEESSEQSSVAQTANSY